MLHFMKVLNARAKLWQVEITTKVYSEEKFRRAIEIERARVDRSGQCFSVVSFETGNSKENGQLKRSLLEIIDRRLRSTDTAGWIDEKHIGILLHNTPPDSAWNFIKHLRREIASEVPFPDYDIYTYPTDENNKNVDQRNSKANRNTHKSGKIGGSSFKELSTVTNTARRGFETISSHSNEDISGDSTKQVLEIHPLFCQGIPVWKRFLDIMGSSMGLIILFPVFLLIIILIKIVSPGPVFFKQERVGICGKRFIFWKFRTMPHNADTKKHQRYLAALIKESDDKPMAKLDEELQIIPFGNFLRKSCLDELPQLFNVLCGDMSLVGPRPPIPYEVIEYGNWHNGRLDTVPGMTGLWQVSGKNRLTFLEMVRLDIRYTRQMSFWSEIKILLMTPFAIFSQAANNGQKIKSLNKGSLKNNFTF